MFDFDNGFTRRVENRHRNRSKSQNKLAKCCFLAPIFYFIPYIFPIAALDFHIVSLRSSPIILMRNGWQACLS